MSPATARKAVAPPRLWPSTTMGTWPCVRIQASAACAAQAVSPTAASTANCRPALLHRRRLVRFGRPRLAPLLAVCRVHEGQHLGMELQPVGGGLLLIGLDVIGDCLTEINVTSPTCFQEITQQAGFDVPAMFVDALEAALAA